MTTKGTCALCLSQNVDLQDSHVLSQWVYKRIAFVPGTTGPKNPVMIRGGVAVETSKQIHGDFLCSACELRRGNHENYVSRICWDSDGTFPIMAKLCPVPRLRPGEPFTLADVRDFDAGSAAYFAVSTIWLADAMGAAGVIKPLQKLNLGPKHREQLRQYLNVEQSFPTAARIAMTVFRPDNGPVHFWRMATLPFTESDHALDEHRLLVCGLEFQLVVGALLPIHLDEICLVHSSRKLVGFRSSFAAGGHARGYSSSQPARSRVASSRRSIRG